MEKRAEFVPTLPEWDALVLLWRRANGVFSVAMTLGDHARLSWVTKQFVKAHPSLSVTHGSVYSWLAKNVATVREAARPSRPFVPLEASP